MQAWTANHFGRYFLNSSWSPSSTTCVTALLSSMMAYRVRALSLPRPSALLFGLLLLGLMVPTMMLIIPQFLLATHARADQLAERSRRLLRRRPLALNTFLLRGFFEEIPRELDEAMVVDGADPWTRFTRLYLPLSRPALATVGDLLLPRQLG